MRANWPNIIALLLTISDVMLLVKERSSIWAFLATMDSVGPGGDPSEQVRGLIAYAMNVMLVVAIVAIVVKNRRDP